MSSEPPESRLIWLANALSATGSSRRQTVRLTGVARLRVLMWSRKVLALAGCDAKDFAELYTTPGLPHPKLNIYENAAREPSKRTLKAIEHGHPLDTLDQRPFEGSEELFLIGPDGVALWDVLAGVDDACHEVIADALFHTAEYALDQFGGLGPRIAAMYAVMLHGDSLGRITHGRNRWPDLSGWVNGTQPNLIEVEAEELAADNARYGDQTQQYSIRQLVAVMALWILARKDCIYRLETSYLLQGIFFRAVREMLPEVAKELEAWFAEGIEWVPTVDAG
ncbi:hypothetical protein [Paraburkholderia acidicola]|uniref:hypothetical protein n=1 Tax=Paraburkholderia acidicola TaxID=1912599 RepID=UPI001055D74C|nr:hypothetical protein [Paraburkholderia acidicola]